MQYLVTTLRIAITDSGKTLPASQSQQWSATYDDLAVAMSHYDDLKLDPTCIAAVVTKWVPGRLEPTRNLKHGDAGSRGCAGGIPTEHVVAAGSRLHQSWSSAKWFSVSGEWSDDAEDVGREVSTQPPGNFTLRAKVPIDEAWGTKELHRRYIAKRPTYSDSRIAEAIGYSESYVKSLR